MIQTPEEDALPQGSEASVPAASGEPDDTPDPDVHQEMDAMMDQYLNQMGSSLEKGQLLHVPIVAIQADHVLVDVGEKAEGSLPRSELSDSRGDVSFSVGDLIDVLVVGHDSESGLVLLSYTDAKRHVALRSIEEAFKSGTPAKGKVLRVVKGGLIVDVGPEAFLPASQIDLRRVEDFDVWIGQTIEFIVLEFDPRKRRIVVSRRRLLEEERAKSRKEVFERFEVGQIVEAEVKRIVDFGAFVDLGGFDGLIPRGEIAWDRMAKPGDYFKVGQPAKAKIIEMDSARGKVTLSRRQLTPSPWETAVEKYPTGSSIEGDVVSLTHYGAFVRLEEGLDGMIHVSDMAWDSTGKKPSDYLTVGTRVQTSILNVDAKTKRISLGLKQLTQDPWNEIEARYPPGKRLKGKVTGLTKYGAFVELEPGIEGMVHVSDFSWDQQIDQPRDVVEKDQELEVCVIAVDRERHRISLGVKQLSDSPVMGYSHEHKIGDVVEGKVKNLTEFGAFIELAEGIEGFIHVSQLDKGRVESPAALLKIGEVVEAEITKIELATGKISLSRRQFLKRRKKNDWAGYMGSTASGGANLGELLAEVNLEDDLPES
ncbi:30S ribosomal protein S1 [Candidatus Sumerlaeota bacterium]|nr:30S ribosomal protein S1 [Candidatus Sumerlaeota bacterium]